jgi:hypothetical protein
MMEQALQYLNQLIEQGMDYPDAQYKAATRHSVDADALQQAYDDQF